MVQSGRKLPRRARAFAAALVFNTAFAAPCLLRLSRSSLIREMTAEAYAMSALSSSISARISLAPVWFTSFFTTACVER